VPRARTLPAGVALPKVCGVVCLAAEDLQISVVGRQSVDGLYGFHGNVTITCSATLQRVAQLSNPATAANTKATQSISALASRVGCGSFVQLKPPRHFGAERRDSPASPSAPLDGSTATALAGYGGTDTAHLPIVTVRAAILGGSCNQKSRNPTRAQRQSITRYDRSPVTRFILHLMNQDSRSCPTV
jgi:hypothetical protein